MDALWFLLAFAGMTALLWWLGVPGLAVAFAGCGIVVAVVEAVWWICFHRADPSRSTISKEVGRMYAHDRLRFYAVLAVIGGGAVGLIWHLVAMGR